MSEYFTLYVLINQPTYFVGGLNMVKIILGIIGIIIEIALVVFFISKLYKQYKESKTIDEKVVFFLILFIFAVPLIIYYLDRYNVFSNLKWIENTDSDRWFNFLATYISSIFGALIGAIALILMTKHQMDRQDEKDKEIVRVNNMPLLTYKLSRNTGEVNLENLLETNCKKGISIDFELNIKNVGMNAIKKSFIVLSSEDFLNPYYNRLENNGCIDKNESVTIYRYLELSKGKHTINFTIYYCDLINNWYSQNITLNFEITTMFDNDDNIYISKMIIEDAILLDEEPKELINLL